MKKFFKFLKIPVALCTAAALFGFYYKQIPSEYSCYPGQAPSDSVIYTLEGESAEGESYSAKVKLFGLLPIKDATVHQISQKQLTVLGTPFGVKLYTKGVIVVDTEEESPGVKAGIQVGDIILTYNNEEIRSNADLREQVQKCGGKRQKAIMPRLPQIRYALPARRPWLPGLLR